MSTNISKKKRDELSGKLSAIRTYISKAPQDENTERLLTYLGQIEKDIKGKKYGLVFEKHREGIDEILDTHTPVLSEEQDLFIDNGGQMNFLIEGDNLAALQLLTKTRQGKIDLIYIDPPYNMGKGDFVYDDDYVDKEDGYRHSKWISFMEQRLKLARDLVTPNGVIVISIGYHEVNNLILLCEDLFLNKQVVTVTVQTSGGKPAGGFNYLHEYLVFITSADFQSNSIQFAGGNARSPFEGLTLATFDQTQRPNQTYPIFIDNETRHIVGCGLSLADRVRNGSYAGNLADFKFDYTEAPEGTSAIWPVSSKGGHCVWRLISPRLLDDWSKGYLKVSKNKSAKNPNEFSIQYLPEGVIKKIANGTLQVVGTEPDCPTLVFGDNQTVGSDIPTIWTEKGFHTTKGTQQLKDIFGTKKFSYPKPLELVETVIQACCASNATILDFFAGSGTTGHAVMQLNNNGDNDRKFILCTNNENNICRDVTYERIHHAINKEGYSASLKYYRIDYVPISEKMYYEYADELLNYVRELVELENGINFVGNAELAIMLTDEELAKFMENIADFERCQTLYLGHDVLLSGAQEALIKKYDVKVNIIPDYYYQELEG